MARSPKRVPTPKKVKASLADLRSEERFPERIPVALRVQSHDGEVEHEATTIDISILGLQVETTGRLEPGQLVIVPQFGDCVVVWVRTQGPDKPCQAGLKMVNHALSS